MRKILGYSAFFGIFYSLWFGFYEILLALGEKAAELLQEFGLNDVQDFADKISDGLRKEADRRAEEQKDNFETRPQQIPYTLIDIDFESDEMLHRYEFFLEGLSEFMKKKCALFKEPGIYLNSTSSVSMQKRVGSIISRTLIKGETF